MDEAAIMARRLYQSQWREKNREHIREYKREWNAKNADRVNEHTARYWTRKAQERMNKE